MTKWSVAETSTPKDFSPWPPREQLAPGTVPSVIKKVSEIFSKNLQTALPMIKKHARVSMIKCL